YQWYAEPYVHNGTLYFAGGRLEEGNVRMDALFALNMKTHECEKLEPELTNYSYVYPARNDAWLVYFDSKKDGGGYIRALHQETGVNKIVKEVYVGQPRLHLSGDILAWMERTGSRMDKLFVADLNTLENVCVKTFNGSAYGQSDISLSNGELIFAADGTGDLTPDGKETSAIYSLSVLEGGVAKTVQLSTYVHDPVTNGADRVWRDGSHGESDALYWSKNGATAKKLAENIVDYGLSTSFAAYSQNEAIFIYVFNDDKTIRITPEGERAQLLGVSGGAVVWMDVTTRDREVMKFAQIE
ncbi:hypothetical protein LJC27_03185, partial [Christensenellaceae bacterium OttesenSCG-928-M15]|nr:hypothetical protein [Christensenellaceae bacterium OttesenSCG-928-M15]